MILKHNPKYNLLDSQLLLILDYTSLDYSSWYRLYDLHDEEYGLIVRFSKDDNMNEVDRILITLDWLFDNNHPCPSRQNEIIKKIEQLAKKHQKLNSTVSITL